MLIRNIEPKIQILILISSRDKNTKTYNHKFVSFGYGIFFIDYNFLKNKSLILKNKSFVSYKNIYKKKSLNFNIRIISTGQI